ncbi:threonine/serine exporter family protein, partial [Escherichia sp. R-CC3]
MTTPTQVASVSRLAIAQRASPVLMYIRQLLAQRHLHPQINFCLTAFAATTISGLLLQLPTFSNTPTIAMAASVLLLVPGFPL